MALRVLCTSESGQAAVEYLVVSLVLIIAICGMAALWHFISSGSVPQLFQESSSHALSSIGGFVDVLLY